MAKKAKSKAIKVSVQFNVPGLKEEFLTELRRRSKFKGTRGATYRKMLRAIA